MEEKRNNRAVEKRLKDALKNDRARIQVGRISHFGLLEMSRQRIRASVLESTTQVCEHCGGTGHVRSQSSVALHVLRSIEEFLLKSTTHNITVRTTPQTALYLLNQKRETIIEMERRFGVSITIEGDTTIGAAHLAIDRGTAVETPVKIENIAAEFVYPEDDDDDLPVAFDEDEDDEAPAEAAEAGEKPAQRHQRQGEDGEGGSRGKRRRRRRGRRDRDGDQTGPRALENGAGSAAEALSDDDEGDEDEGDHVAAGGAAESAEDSERPKKRRRRGKRGGRRNRNGDEDHQTTASGTDENGDSDIAGEDEAPVDRPVVEPELTGGEADVVETAVDDEAVVNEAVASLSDETVPAEPAALAEAGEGTVEDKPKKRRAPRRKKADAAAEAAPEAAADGLNAADEAQAAQPVAEVAETPPSTAEEDGQTAAETSSVTQPEPAVASTPASPVVSSNGGEATDKPKKGGWWQRRGFF
jgi:ribonuclease E